MHYKKNKIMRKIIFSLLLLISLPAFSQKDTSDSYYYDGALVKFYDTPHYFISMCLERIKYCGDYYCTHISILNKDINRFDFIPETVSAIYDNGKKRKEATILGYEEYNRKVKNKQEWENTLNALAICFQTFSDCYNGSSTTTVKQTGNTITAKTYTKPNYTETLIENAKEGEAIHQNQIQTIKQGYLKRNTIFKNREIAGYINIPYRETERLIIALPINGENYLFDWRFSKKAKEKFDDMYRIDD